jgi:hypothetical protein
MAQSACGHPDDDQAVPVFHQRIVHEIQLAPPDRAVVKKDGRSRRRSRQNCHSCTTRHFIAFAVAFRSRRFALATFSLGNYSISPKLPTACRRPRSDRWSKILADKIIHDILDNYGSHKHHKCAPYPAFPGWRSEFEGLRDSQVLEFSIL